MEIISYTSADVDGLVERLQAGAVIVYPTETCYGLGCDARNAAAVRKIFAIKQRQEDKSLLVVVANTGMLHEYIEWGSALERLSRRYWPGPLTVVTRARPECTLPPGVLAPDHTLAFRVTSHPLAAALSSGLDGPLVSTSSNISSQESAYDIETVCASFGAAAVQPDIVIDAGPLPHHNPSTVVRVEHGTLTVLRQGEIVVH